MRRGKNEVCLSVSSLPSPRAPRFESEWATVALPRARRKLRIAWLHWLAVPALLLLAAEFACRLDDWISFNVPLTATPDREHDLLLHETWGERGKPNGAFRKWQLNEFGFRSP